MRTKEAPPPLATSNGNFHILPRPTAEPAAASIKPSLEFHVPLLNVGVVAKGLGFRSFQGTLERELKKKSTI